MSGTYGAPKNVRTPTNVGTAWAHALHDPTTIANKTLKTLRLRMPVTHPFLVLFYASQSLTCIAAGDDSTHIAGERLLPCVEGLLCSLHFTHCLLYTSPSPRDS